MPNRQNVASLRSNYNFYASVTGDSLSKPEAGPVGLYYMWPHVLARKLQRAGCTIISRNFARDGGKTDNVTAKGMLTRSSELSMFGTPAIGIIFGGTNDRRTISPLTFSGTTATATSTAHGYVTGNRITVTGANNAGANVTNAVITVVDANTFTFTVPSGLTSPDGGTGIVACLQTQANLRALILTMKFGSSGAVQNPSNLSASTEAGTLYTVIEDNSSTGGIAAPQSIYTSTIQGSLSGSPPSVWQCLNPNAGETGWNRVAISSTTPTKCSKFVVVGQHYNNWSTSQGDNYTNSTVYAAWNTSSANQGVRAAQIAAATAEHISTAYPVLYCDTYAYMQNLISGGREVQGSASWHVADANIHLNTLGHKYVAEAVFATIPTNWHAGLTQS